MTCNISLNKVRKWEIDYQYINNLYDYLYLNQEVAGKFSLSTHNKNVSKVIKSNDGSADTVSAPHAIVNWHSHPVSCYLNEKTYYGWPSGEDLRETIVFGLLGSACHIVPSIEGTYKIQPNPCILIDMINIGKKFPDTKKLEKILKSIPVDDFLRGLIVFCVEVYFKITHEFRLIKHIDKKQHQINKILNYNGSITSPLEFIELVNNAEFNHMISAEFVKYLKDYENDSEILCMDEHGSRNNQVSVSKLSNGLILDSLEILKDLGLSCNLPDIYYDNPLDNWKDKTTKLFKIQLYENTLNGKNYIQINNDEKIDLMKNIKNVKIRLESSKNIEFYMFDMSGDCSHKNISSHIKKISENMGKKNKGLIEIFGSSECKFCRIAEDKISKKNKKFLVFNVGKDNTDILNDVDYEYIMFKYESIGEAIEDAKKYAHTDSNKIQGIPSFFVNGKLRTDYEI